jgi:RNA polymerase sigma factor (sigma-70 family)
MGEGAEIEASGQISQEAFIEQYRRLCGYIARRFIYRQSRQFEENTGKSDAGGNTAIPKCDDLAAQDLASAALLRLVRCPARYRDQPRYVRRIIVNAIIDEFKRQQKIFHYEFAAPATIDGEDWFDTQVGPDGLARATQQKLDAGRAITALSSLTEGERLVVEFYFGLNGARPLKEHAIASKLARTRWWVERRLTSGLIKLRTQLGASAEDIITHG